MSTILFCKKHGEYTIMHTCIHLANCLRDRKMINEAVYLLLDDFELNKDIKSIDEFDYLEDHECGDLYVCEKCYKKAKLIMKRIQNSGDSQYNGYGCPKCFEEAGIKRNLIRI